MLNYKKSKLIKIKMKRFITLFISLLVLGAILFSTVGCSEENSSDSIVGVWKNGDITMTLGKDGSYLSEYRGNYPQVRKGTYSYNPTQKLMVIHVMAVAGSNGAYSDTFIVQTLTETTLVLLYTDGDVEGYYIRQ